MGDIVGTIDLSDAKTAIMAAGVAIGALYAAGVGVRAVLSVIRSL